MVADVWTLFRWVFAVERHATPRRDALEQGRPRPSKVDVVDLNPHLLNDNWRDYAAFVLFHEYLHVLGHRAHDRTFRALEARWPHRQRRLVEKRSRTQEGLRGPPGIGCVQTCDERYPRQRKGSGRYMCRRCKTVLKDVPSRDIE